MLNNNDSDELSNLIVSRKLGKLKVSLDCEEIYSLDKLNYHLNYQNLIYPYVRLNNHKNTTSRLDLIERTNNKHLNHLETRLSKKGILYRLAKGDTLMIDSVDVFESNVRLLAKFLSNLLNAQVTSNLYYTFKNNVGINLHFDQHDVLALQVYGRKKWNFVKNIMEDTSNRIDLSLKPILDSKSVEVESVYLEEGEFLFIPKGMWHYTETDSENSSLHIAFGLEPPKKIDLINLFLKQYLGSSCEENVYSMKLDDFEEIVSNMIKKINIDDIKINEKIIADFLKQYINKYVEIELA